MSKIEQHWLSVEDALLIIYTPMNLNTVLFVLIRHRLSNHIAKMLHPLVRIQEGSKIFRQPH